MIALITPTGARPTQIRLCASFMHRQDYQGKVLWVIVDDAVPVTADCVPDNFREGWRILKLFPSTKWRPGQNTQARNLLAGVNALCGYEIEAVFIIEDDDYYKPNYLRVMMEKLQGFDLVGEKFTIYYNVEKHLIFYNKNDMHASLFQVAFTPSLIDTFKMICADPKGIFIDVRFFGRVRATSGKINMFNSEQLAIGIKGQPGRAGIGYGHRMGLGRYDLNRMEGDPDKKKLQELLGDDYIYYN
jgi:hypothetical protein